MNETLPILDATQFEIDTISCPHCEHPVRFLIVVKESDIEIMEELIDLVKLYILINDNINDNISNEKNLTFDPATEHNSEVSSNLQNNISY